MMEMFNRETETHMQAFNKSEISIKIMTRSMHTYQLASPDTLMVIHDIESPQFKDKHGDYGDAGSMHCLQRLSSVYI